MLFRSKKDKKLEVNIDEQVKTPDEVIEHIAREYTPALDRLLTPEGRQQYFGNAAILKNGQLGATPVPEPGCPTGLTEAEVLEVRKLREKWGEGLEGGLPFGAAGQKGIPIPEYNELSPAPKVPKWLQFMKHMTSGFALLLEVGGALCFIAYGMDSSSPDNLYLGDRKSVV